MAQHETKHKPSNILQTSANLMGLCFIVFTAFRFSNKSEETIADELTALAIVLFLTSSIFSYLCVRGDSKHYYIYERAADYIFMIGLFTLAIITGLIVFKVI